MCNTARVGAVSFVEGTRWMEAEMQRVWACKKAIGLTTSQNLWQHFVAEQNQVHCGISCIYPH